MDNRFSLFNIDSKDFQDKLAQLISPSVIHENANAPLRSLIEYVKRRLGVKSVLFEEEYIDSDYQSLYSKWYSKAFKQYSSLCQRLHFFTGDIDLKSLYDGSISDALYCGYSVITPLIRGRVGRTVIKPFQDSIQINQQSNFPVILESPSYAHLFGRRFKVMGCPYISQDVMVMVCAQSAIWMAIQFLHNRYGRYGIQRNFPHEITDAATLYLPWGGRIFPSGGLTVLHMVNALSNLGYSPILDLKSEKTESWAPLNWIVKYIDSEIPIILSIKNPPHAILAIGSLQGSDSFDTITNSSAISSIDNWTSGIIVNDDGLGPYKIMPRIDGQYEFLSQGSDRDLVPANSHDNSDENWWKSMNQVDGVIVPLPKEVSIQARHTDEIVAGVLRRDADNNVLSRFELQKSNNQFLAYTLDLLPSEFPLSSPLDDSVVTRAYLIRSMEFLKRVKSSYPPKLADFYTKQHYPLYIWVIELMLRSELEKSGPKLRQIFGEIILDSTANKYAPSLFSLHMNGFVVKRDIDSEKFVSTDLFIIERYKSSHPH
ncbi:hypothetical protein TRIP_C20087 [Candidatus Zixiibacteriota bacterium]|nr:hypothetical protein TRIP_C20087 [candidate division Zixibacteria bacterium]